MIILYKMNSLSPANMMMNEVTGGEAPMAPTMEGGKRRQRQSKKRQSKKQKQSKKQQSKKRQQSKKQRKSKK